MEVVSGRYCAYCPDEHDLGEVKECVEDMQKKIYELDADKLYLERKLVELSSAYYKTTGHFYEWENDNENKNSEV